MAKNEPNQSIHSFTLDSYIELIEAILEKGYQPVTYAQADPAKKHIILRHDVDFDLDSAVTMAEREVGHGLHATYFVMLRSEFYSITSDSGLCAVKKLAALGHEIGLHFDASIYNAEKEDLVQKVSLEAESLSSLIGLPVTSMSLHRPSPVLLDQELNIDGLINSYSSKYFNSFGYCSDSNGGWHHGHPMKHDAIASGLGLHLLTHPIWWVGGNEEPLQKLHSFLRRRSKFLEDQLALNCKLFHNHTL